MAEHPQVADADTALQARLDALESETHPPREVLTSGSSATLDEALPTGRGQRRSRDARGREVRAFF